MIGPRMLRLILVMAVLASLAVGVGSASGPAAGAPTARQVVLELRAAGLPIGKFKVYSTSTDANHLLGRPGQYTGKVNFRDRRINGGGYGFAVSSGGSVELFTSRSDAKGRFDYVSAIFRSASPAIPGERVYLVGNAVLRLSHVLTPTQAKKYEAALRRLV